MLNKRILHGKSQMENVKTRVFCQLPSAISHSGRPTFVHRRRSVSEMTAERGFILATLEKVTAHQGSVVNDTSSVRRRWRSIDGDELPAIVRRVQDEHQDAPHLSLRLAVRLDARPHLRQIAAAGTDDELTDTVDLIGDAVGILRREALIASDRAPLIMTSTSNS